MADVALSVTVKDQYVQRVLNALNYGDGKDIEISITDATGNRYDFTFQYDKGALNDKTFAEEFLKQAMRAFTRCYELGVDNDRYRSDINAVTPPTQNVPDGIIE